MKRYSSIEESPLLAPTNLLDEFNEDYTIFKLNNLGYSYEYLWKRFIRI